MTNETNLATLSTDSSVLEPEEQLKFFTFYEQRADAAKSQAWSETTWILTLNAGVLGFALTLYIEHASTPSFLVLEFFATAVGIALSAFLIYVLQELGTHIAGYWTSSNKLGARYPVLRPFIGARDAAQAAADPCYSAPYPKFCRRLQVLAALFILGHVGWLGFVATR